LLLESYKSLKQI